MTSLVTRSTPESLRHFFANLDQCLDKNPLTHGLHPYPAKFIPHIPRELIRAYAKPGAPVLDPMCGSGTSVLEASLAGHPAYGSDLNPVATLVAGAKTRPLTDEALSELEELVSGLRADAAAAASDPLAARRAALASELPEFHNRDKWFSETVAWELRLAKDRTDGLRDPGARALALCCFSAIIVGVSNQESETRWCAKPSGMASGETLRRLAGRLVKAAEAVRALRREPTRGETAVFRADARALPLPDESVGMVVTSPPYANAHDYYLYNKLRLFWLGYDVRPIQEAEFGSRNKHSDLGLGIEHYTEAMEAIFRETRRVLMPGGTAAFVVADSVIRKELFQASDMLMPAAASAGLQLVDHYRFGHAQFNSSFQRGFGARRDKQTHVLVWRRG